jgi:hypothetical protein
MAALLYVGLTIELTEKIHDKDPINFFISF